MSAEQVRPGLFQVILPGVWHAIRVAARWLRRNRRYVLSCLAIAMLCSLLGFRAGAAVALMAWLLPALFLGIWSAAYPTSFIRLFALPARRRAWRRWAKKSWPRLAHECGLSVQRGSRDKATWVHPKLLDAITSDSTLTLRVRARTGQTVGDLAVAIPRIGTAARAVSWRSISRTPSTLDIVLQMQDPLAGTRFANPSANAPGTVAVTVGRVDDGSQLVVDLADAWHLAIQGMTRSGKSVLTYTLLGSLAHRPEALVCGLDPTGILLGPWRDAPGAELRHLGTADMATAGEVAARIVAEMDRRIAWLMRSGLDKVPDPTPDLPVLVVVLEEYPGLLAAAEADDAAQGRKPAERVAPRIKAGVRRLIQEGAKAGVRVVLLAQRMDASIVGGAERSNLGTRISLRVDNGDAVRMLHASAGPDLVDGLANAEPGKGLIETPGHSARWFKADLLTYEQYTRVVRTAGLGARPEDDRVLCASTTLDMEV